jgi:hypothetical protein
MATAIQIGSKGRAEEKPRPGSRTKAPKPIVFRRVASTLSTQELGAKLSPDLREWVDRVIVPALLREYLGEETVGNCLAKSGEAVRHSETDALSSEEVR